MNAAHTTTFLFDNGEYFAAHLDNGGARVGMNSIVALDVPADHDLYPAILALNESTVEEFIDDQIMAGRIDPRVFG
jgi:hypothetical protein